MNLRQFEKKMKEYGRLVDVNTAKTVRKAALVIDQTVVLATPVDKGRARSNWLVAVGAPDTRTIEAYHPGEGLGIGEGQNAQAAMNQGSQAIAGYAAGLTIYISNNLPYIVDLDNGSSAQAPNGMTALGIQAGRKVIQQAKLLEK